MAHVLIIEDNISLNKVYSLVLQKEGHVIDSAFDGREGLKLVETCQPDIILLDMLMPHMGGLEFLRRFPFNEHPKTRIVVLSNINEDKDISQAIKLGASQYVVKADNSPRQLAERINALAV